MRFLHFSDTHLGAEIHGRRDPQTGYHTHLKDFLACLDFVVQTAIDKDVDLVLFTGDAYHHPRPDPLPQREFFKRLITLSERGVPVLLLAGNHDMPPGYGEAAALDIVNVVKIPGVQFVRSPKVVSIPTRKGEVHLVCLPHPQRRALITVEEERGWEEDKVQRVMVQRVEELLNKLVRQVPANGAPILLAAHLWVEGAEFAGSERILSATNEPIVPPSVLRRPQFAYVALGHIHRHQVMDDLEPALVYAGSLGRLDFGEEKHPKGFLLVELEQTPKGKWGVKNREFFQTPTRPFVTVELDLRSAAEPMQEAEKQLKQDRRLDNAVARVFLFVTEAQRDQINLVRLRELLEERVNYLAALELRTGTTATQPTAEVRGLEELEHFLKQSPLQLLDLWLQERSSQAPELAQRKEQLLRLAEQLLEASDLR